jgi:hypothetical protein
VKATTGRIWEAASTDKARPVLACVMFDAKAATLTATNSYIAARVACEVEEGDESGLIPAEALKVANGKSLRVADGKATLDLGNGERSWTLLQQEFPNVDKYLTESPEIATPFGVNADLLRQLSDALGCGTKRNTPIALHPARPLKPMLVTSPRDGVGIIMPVRLMSGSEPLVLPDLWDDDAVIDAVWAAVEKLDGRRGKKKAAQAFRDAMVARAAEDVAA